MVNDRLSVALKNDLSEIERLSRVVAEFGARNRISEEIVFDLNLSLEEIICNVISYAYDDENEHEINISVWLEDGELTAEVKDDGRPFNPLEIPEPDIGLPLDERPIGGLGMHLVRNLMDRLEYSRLGDKNILVVKKRMF